MALPNAAKLRKLSEQAWAKRKPNTQGTTDRVNSIKYSILRQAEEEARNGLKKVNVSVMAARNADDNEVIDRVCDELSGMGFTITVDLAVNNRVLIEVSWLPEKS